MIELVAAVLIVLVSSAIASGTEAALFSMPLVRIRQLAETKSPAALALLKIRENMSRPIATIVIMNNISNIVGSIIVGSIAIGVLGSTWLGVFSGLLTLLVILFGEIIPKTLGERHTEPIGLFMGRPVLALTFVLTPLVWLIERLTAPITRQARLPTTNEAEIKLLARIGSQEGVIERDEFEMIQRVFRLNDTYASDIMTHRIHLTSLQVERTLADAKDDILASPHSRILVVGDSIDDVHGIVLRDKLLEAFIAGQDDQPIAAFTLEARFVPESIRADRLLEVFLQAHKHLAVVLDEFGGTAGVVTLEDVLEVLTGEIFDETDTGVNLRRIMTLRRGKNV